MEFTSLESAVLTLIIDEYGWEFPGLAEQLAAAHPVKRDNTGGGFFTDIAIKNGIPLSHVDSPLDGVVVRPDGMRTRLELLLFFKDGYANLLEGYSIEAENTSNVDFNAGRFSELGLLWPSRKPAP